MKALIESQKINHHFLRVRSFKPVTVNLFYSVLRMSGIYQRVSWKLNGCTSIFTSLQLLWSCFMNWTGTTLSGKTNKLNVLQNWKKSGTINNDIIIQPHISKHLGESWKCVREYFWQTLRCLEINVVKHCLECLICVSNWI